MDWSLTHVMTRIADARPPSPNVSISHSLFTIDPSFHLHLLPLAVLYIRTYSHSLYKLTRNHYFPWGGGGVSLA